MRCRCRSGCAGQGAGIEWVNAAFVKAVEAQGSEEVYARQIELLEQRQRQSVERQLSAKGKPSPSGST